MQTRWYSPFWSSSWMLMFVHRRGADISTARKVSRWNQGSVVTNGQEFNSSTGTTSSSLQAPRKQWLSLLRWNTCSFWSKVRWRGHAKGHFVVVPWGSSRGLLLCSSGLWSSCPSTYVWIFKNHLQCNKALQGAKEKLKKTEILHVRHRLAMRINC